MWSFVPRVDSRVCVRSCSLSHTNIQTYLACIYILSLARSLALSLGISLFLARARSLSLSHTHTDYVSFVRAQGRVQEALALVNHPDETFDEKLCGVNPWPQYPVLKPEPWIIKDAGQILSSR